MKTIAAISALILFLSAAAWSDGQAPVTFSGKGTSGIEVRDASGKVTEVRGPSDLRLNQIPAEAVAREEALRAKRREIAGEVAARRAELTAEELAAASASAAATAAAEAETAAATEEAVKLKEAQKPRKVRGKTVRGTRFIENPVVEPETPPAPQGPVLSASGDKKALQESEGTESSEAEKPADSPSTP